MNIDKVRQLVVNGPEIWPGAIEIVGSDGRKRNLKYVRDRTEVAKSITPGSIVYRHLIDGGDIVLFNRQPSLHRMSIMGHIARCCPAGRLGFTWRFAHPTTPTSMGMR